VGGAVVHFAARSRDRENARRSQRVDYLLSAYRSMIRAAHRALEFDSTVRREFEDAIADVILLGDADQVELARQVSTELAQRGGVPVDALLVSLRRQLRTELDLSVDELEAIPVLRVESPGE
jgi:hypothetical protein